MSGTNVGLNPSDIVNVSVVLSPTPVAERNFGALLIVGSSPVIPIAQRIRQYTTLSGVIADFGTSTPEYLAADLFFSQSPQPSLLYVGRWAQTAAAGVLTGGAFTSTTALNALLASLQAIATGSMTITLNAGSATNLTGLNFTSINNLNGAATIIQNALSGATVTWNATYGQFVITSNTTGVSSAVSYASPTGSGTDVSSLLYLTAATGAVASQGVAAETALSAITTLAVNQAWYGCMFAPLTALADADALAVAGFIQAASPVRIVGFTTQEAAALVATSTTDLAYELSAAQYSRSFVQYCSSSPYAVASLYGRAFTVNFNGNNTTITLKFQQEPGVVAETLTETQYASLKTKNCNVFVNYSNGVAIVQEGVMSNGYFFDEIQGTDWLANAVQVAMFNALYLATTKIPFTDTGVNRLVNAADSALLQGVTNGLIGQGLTWNGPSFGNILNGQVLPNGWYTYVPRVANLPAANVVGRIAPTLQIAICLAGAVHFAGAVINVTR